MPTLDCHTHLEEQHNCFRRLTFSWLLLRHHGLKQEKNSERFGKKGWWIKFAEIYFSVIPPPNLMTSTVNSSCFMSHHSQADPFALAYKFPKIPWSFYTVSSLGFPLKWNVEKSFCGKECGWLQYDADSVLQLKSHRIHIKIGRWCRIHFMWFLS